MAGELRPWHVGVLWDQDELSARYMIDGLSAIDGLVVGDNEPYSGRHPADYTVDHHAEGGGLRHVLEIRQDQIESPAGVERWIRIMSRLLRGLLSDATVTRPGRQAGA